MTTDMIGRENEQLSLDQAKGMGSNQNRRNRSRLFLVISLVMVCSVLAYGYWWFFQRNRVSTDNAYVAVGSAGISSRVAGTICQINVASDDFVAAGDVLLKLDPEDCRILVDKARAVLERIEAEMRMSELGVGCTEAQTAAQAHAAQAFVQMAQDKHREAQHRLEELERSRTATEAEFTHAKRDFERYQNLFKDGAGSEQLRDKSNTAFKKATAQLGAMESQIAAARAALEGTVQDVDRANAQLDTAKADQLKVDIEKHKLASLMAKRAEVQAELETAELNLSYCTIRSPLTGYIAQKRIQIGERVQPGQPMLAVVPLQEVWVEANFKETQLDEVRLGQPVEIKADMYSDHVYRGKVYGIRAGTGAAFSLLTAENATGNWIKVVQRVPVKILLDSPPPPEKPLRVGSSRSNDFHIRQERSKAQGIETGIGCTRI